MPARMSRSPSLPGPVLVLQYLVAFGNRKAQLIQGSRKRDGRVEQIVMASRCGKAFNLLPLRRVLRNSKQLNVVEGFPSKKMEVSV